MCASTPTRVCTNIHAYRMMSQHHEAYFRVDWVKVLKDYLWDVYGMISPLLEGIMWDIRQMLTKL